MNVIVITGERSNLTAVSVVEVMVNVTVGEESNFLRIMKRGGEGPSQITV